MKRLALVIFIAGVTVILSSNHYAIAVEKANYFIVKGGIYSPESNDLEDFDKGFNGEIAFGHYLTQNLALELGLGYFQTDTSETVYLNGFGDVRVDAEVTSIPLTLSIKGIYPIGNVELIGIAGFGFVYFTKGEITISDVSLDDDDTPYGFHLGGGLNYNITKNIFIGLEGKYLWASAEFNTSGMKLDADLDGFVMTANIGIRF